MLVADPVDPPSAEGDSDGPMLIHNVVFWLKEDLGAVDRATFESEVRLLAEISYLERGYAGPPAATPGREVVDQSFDFSTSLHFKTLEDHEFYQTECPDHARFVERCKGCWERVVVYDVAPGEG